jgi:transposase
LGNSIDADYTQTFLFPPSLEDFISEDDPARFIRAFVDSLAPDELGIVQKNDTDGRPPYSWALLLRVWLYGWFERVTSTRALEKMCHRDVGMLWLTGMHYPDHNTLWRFYRDNRQAMKKLFKQSVRVALKNSLVGMVLHALDGTKIKANASRFKDLSKKKLEKILRTLDASIEDFLQHIEDESADTLKGVDSLPEELRDHVKLRKKIQADLAELSRHGVNNLNKTDNDSRLMHTRNGTVDYSYNAQAVADSSHGIVVSADVTTDERDSQQLSQQIDNVKENMGCLAESTVADSGYYSGEELSKAEKCDSDVLVSIPARFNDNQHKSSDDIHHVNNYEYDKRRDCFICPRGGMLHFVREDKKNRIYQCGLFKKCIYHAECTKSRTRRVVMVSKYHTSIRSQRKKQQKREAIEKLARRKTIIEPIFGIIKEQLGFRRFSGRGYKNASAQWQFVNCIYNLRKIYRHCGVSAIFA